MQKVHAPLEFTLKGVEVPVTLYDEEDGVKREYKLVEFSGKARDQYLTKLDARMKKNSKGQNIGVASFDGLQAELVSKCLVDLNGESVSVDVIQQFPSSVQQALFKKSQEINGLDVDEDKDDEGNE